MADYSSYQYVPSEHAAASVGTSVPNTSAFNFEVQCFLEGVQVPHSTISVSYGVNSPPTCTLLIPASKIIRDLPETTKIHVFFKDILPTSEGVYEWRLLFDGEMSSYDYSISADGAYMSINGIHSAAYMSMMQLLSLDVAEYIYNPNPLLIGDATIPVVLGQSKVNTRIIKQIIEGKNFNNMADIVFQLMRSVLAGVENSDVGAYYKSKLDVVDGAWKMPLRIHGVTALAVSSSTVKFDSQYNSAGTNNDKYADAALQNAAASMGTASSGSSSGVQGGLSTITADPSMAYQDYLEKGSYSAGKSKLYDDSVWTEKSRANGDTASYTEYKGMNSLFIEKIDLLTNNWRDYKKDSSALFTINSGFRSEVYNASLTEAKSLDSKHKFGKACDISIAGMSVEDIAWIMTNAGAVFDDHLYKSDELEFIHVQVN